MKVKNNNDIDMQKSRIWNVFFFHLTCFLPKLYNYSSKREYKQRQLKWFNNNELSHNSKQQQLEVQMYNNKLK